MTRILIVIRFPLAVLMFGIASSAAPAQEPSAGTYSVRTGADVAAQIPHTPVIMPGDGQTQLMAPPAKA